MTSTRGWMLLGSGDSNLTELLSLGFQNRMSILKVDYLWVLSVFTLPTHRCIVGIDVSWDALPVRVLDSFYGNCQPGLFCPCTASYLLAVGERMRILPDIPDLPFSSIATSITNDASAGFRLNPKWSNLICEARGWGKSLLGSQTKRLPRQPVPSRVPLRKPIWSVAQHARSDREVACAGHVDVCKFTHYPCQHCPGKSSNGST